MIERRKAAELIGLVETNPAVALLGPRQVGKTTLALEIPKVGLPSISIWNQTPIEPNFPSRNSIFQHTKKNSSSWTKSIGFQISSKTFAD